MGVTYRGAGREAESLASLFPVPLSADCRARGGEVGDAEGGEGRHPERLGDDGVREGHRRAVGERRLTIRSDHLGERISVGNQRELKYSAAVWFCDNFANLK